jgi:hypothetical protein
MRHGEAGAGGSFEFSGSSQNGHAPAGLGDADAEFGGENCLGGESVPWLVFACSDATSEVGGDAQVGRERRHLIPRRLRMGWSPHARDRR